MAGPDTGRTHVFVNFKLFSVTQPQPAYRVVVKKASAPRVTQATRQNDTPQVGTLVRFHRE